MHTQKVKKVYFTLTLIICICIFYSFLSTDPPLLSQLGLGVLNADNPIYY